MHLPCNVRDAAGIREHCVNQTRRCHQTTLPITAGINGMKTKMIHRKLRNASSLRVKVSGLGTFGAIPINSSRLSSQFTLPETKSSAC